MAEPVAVVAPTVVDPVNLKTFDRFTLLHILTGYIAGRMQTPFPIYAIGNIGWELAEDRLKDTFPRMFPNPSHDSKENALGDVAAGMLGYLVGLSHSVRK